MSWPSDFDPHVFVFHITGHPLTTAPRKARDPLPSLMFRVSDAKVFTHFRSEIVLDRQEGELITQTFTDRKAIYTRGANADERKKPDDGSDGHGGDEV